MKANLCHNIMNNRQKESRRKELISLLGDLPDRNRKIEVEAVKTYDTNAYICEKLILDLNGIEKVPAYFIKPKDNRDNYPVVLYNHWHGGQYDLGKEQLFQSIQGSVCRPWADELIEMGYAVLAIDHWGFGERHNQTESECFKKMLWHGKIMWGMMIFDSLKAVDYLTTRNDIDTNRIATLGMSMGSTMAWWLTALDTRIKVCVDICCLTDFHALLDSHGLDAHGIYYYVPSLLKHFTTTDINALIAPRPHLALAGNLDILTPPAGLDKTDKELTDIYKNEDAADAWQMLRYNVEHVEIPEMRIAIVNFLKKWF